MPSLTAKHADVIARNIDWGLTVGLIDKYIGCRGVVAEWKTKPANHVAAHTAFQNFDRPCDLSPM